MVEILYVESPKSTSVLEHRERGSFNGESTLYILFSYNITFYSDESEKAEDGRLPGETRTLKSKVKVGKHPSLLKVKCRSAFISLCCLFRLEKNYKISFKSSVGENVRQMRKNRRVD